MILWVALIVVALAFYIDLFRETDAHSDDLLPQWTIARLAVTGHRADSYSFPLQKALIESEIPQPRTSFLDSPHINDIGVSPYPPTMVVLYAPLGLLSCEAAGQVAYVASLVLALAAAVAIAGATRGTVSGFAGAAAILVYPGCAFNLALGQNAMLTLALLSIGWCATARRWDWSAGIAWGLLAYKPHWWVAVFWLPLVLRRWRIVLAMAATAGVLAAVGTLWLGPEAWTRWLAQVRAQDVVAYTDDVFRQIVLGMACDLRGVINRYMPHSDLARPIGWCALGLVGVLGILLTSRSWRRPASALENEPAAPAWLFTVVLVAPYVYYYDECVALLPLLILWSQRANMNRWQLGLLAGLTLGYYCALPYMLYRDPGWAPLAPEGIPQSLVPRQPGWLGGPNWSLLNVLGLWGLSLTIRERTVSR
jgi:hypothetical protein